MARSPKRFRLSKHIIKLLGRDERCLVHNLKMEIRTIYASLSVTQVDSEVDEVLLELLDGKIVQIDDNDNVALTQVGRAEYATVAAREKLKQEKRALGKGVEERKELTKRKKADSREYHELLKARVGELAFLLGKEWRQEYELVKRGPVILDVVWYANPHKISHAFEVQHKGEWKNAIGNLETVRRHYPDCQLFLVVHDEKEITRINQLLGAKLESSIKLLNTSQIQEWVKSLKPLEKTTPGLRKQLLATLEKLTRIGLAL